MSRGIPRKVEGTIMKERSKDKHALLGGSNSKRWLSCNPSARLESLQPQETSPFANEGSLAHDLGELKVRLAFGKCTKAMYNKEEKILRENEDFSNEMVDYCDEYTSYVKSVFEEMKEKYGSAYLLIEERLDYSEYVPEGEGTGDIVICSPGELRVIDLKYGAGVYVSAYENSQMKLYGLGALNAFDLIYNPEIITVTVYQPRMDNISSFTMTTGSLKAWGTHIRPIAEKAFKGEGEFHPCMSNCQFCKINGKCQALDDFVMKMAEYQKTPFMSDEETRRVMSNKALITKFLKQVELELFRKIYNDCIKVEGFKVVAGTGRRTYSDTELVKKALREAGYQDALVMKAPVMIGITDLTKLLGKKEFNSIVGELITVKEGSPKIVADSAKGQSINSIGEFGDVDVDLTSSSEKK
jgi:hypothetical protein